MDFHCIYCGYEVPSDYKRVKRFAQEFTEDVKSNLGPATQEWVDKAKQQAQNSQNAWYNQGQQSYQNTWTQGQQNSQNAWYNQKRTGYGQEVSDKSRTLTLILLLFLGVWGIHHFYNGRIVLGIFYIFTWGFFGVGWLIDLVLILTGRYKDAKGRPVVIW